MFRRLAVFSGGFTLPAAERVAAFGDIAPGQVLDLLSRLADKSLLRVDGNDTTCWRRSGSTPATSWPFR